MTSIETLSSRDEAGLQDRRLSVAERWVSGVHRWSGVGGAILIILAVLVAYWPSLGGGFLWDDEYWIVEKASTPTQRLIHDPRGLYGIWFSREAIDYWPLSNSVFWLQWRLWGMKSTGYRATNLLLHVVGSVL